MPIEQLDAVVALRTIPDDRATSGPLESFLGARFGTIAGQIDLPADLPLREVLDIAEWLGAWRKWGSKTPPGWQRDIGVTQLAHDGFEIMSGGQPAIEAFLDNMIATKKNASVAAASARRVIGKIRPETLGGIFGKMIYDIRHGYRFTTQSHLWFIRILAERCCAAHVLAPEVSLFGHAPVLTSFRTVTQLAKQHGLAADNLRRSLLDLGVIGQDKEVFSNDAIWVDQVQHAVLLNGLVSSLNIAEAALYLGVDVDMVAHLHKAGHLAAMVNRQSADGKRLVRFSKVELDVFSERIASGAATGSSEPDPAKYSGVAMTAMRVGRSPDEVLELLLSGQLGGTIVTGESGGVARVALNVDEVRERVRLPTNSTLISVVEAARLLHTDALRLRNLIEDKKIAGAIDMNPVNRRRQMVISVDVLRDFARTYVTCKALGVYAGVHHLSVGKELRRAGVAFAFSPSRPYARYFKRSDLAGTQYGYLADAGLEWTGA